MPVSSRESYLVRQVMDATPHKLQQMLIGTAIRFVERAQQRYRRGEQESAVRAAARAQQLVGEMLGLLDNQLPPEVTRDAAATYLAAFRALSDVCRTADHQRVFDTLALLKHQQQVWEEGVTASAPAAPFFAKFGR